MTEPQYPRKPSDESASNSSNSSQAATEVNKQDATAPPPSPPPPRPPRWWIGIAVVLLLLTGIASGVMMHEPIMNGVQHVWSRVANDDAAAAQADTQYWTCGMHPWVIEPEPGLCPICHMELVPLDPDKLSGELTINPTVVQNMGVRVAEIKRGPLHKTVRTIGSIAYDETAVRDVNTKMAGWIETLHVDREGQRVHKGDPLLEIYSPELYAAQQEYLLAYHNRKNTADNADLLQSAHTRLRYFDMTDDQIDALEKRDAPQKTLTLYSPYSGVVTAKHVNEGMRIEPNMRLYRIADLSTVWVMVSIYEYQLPYIREGQTATMHLSYLPEREFEGKVAEVYPYLDSSNRQATARLQFDNPDGLLKPGMYATIELQSTLDDHAVLAPSEAVIDTGERQVALVSLGNGRFEPHDVKTGVESEDGNVQILQGLEPGDQVVTSGQFLLDSESRMREALAKMVKNNLAVNSTKPQSTSASASHPSLPKQAQQALAKTFAPYFAIGDALHHDHIDGIVQHAEAFASSFNVLSRTSLPKAPHFWHQHQKEVATVREQAQQLTEPRDLDTARKAYARLSDAFERLITATGVPVAYEKPIDRLICGMRGDLPRRGIWLQPSNQKVRNPYLGQQMPGCHSSRETLPPTEQPTDGASSTPDTVPPATQTHRDTPSTATRPSSVQMPTAHQH